MARIDAWNGMAADTRSNVLYIAGAGGHADYAGNEAIAIDLSQDNPRWRMLRQPTPASQISTESEYYQDGRPSSTHTYYALHFVERLGRIFRVGSGSNWGSGNFVDGNMNAFNVATNDWDPKGSWSAVVSSYSRGYSICKNPATEDIYVATNVNLRRFNAQNGTWSTLAAFPQNGSATYARPCAVDPVRGRVVFFGDQYRPGVGGLLYDIAADRFSTINFTGGEAGSLVSTNFAFVWYDQTQGAFLAKTDAGGQVLRVHPENWSVTSQATSGGAAIPDARNGVHTRWQYLPNLGGYAYYPAAGSGVWFIATR